MNPSFYPFRRLIGCGLLVCALPLLQAQSDAAAESGQPDASVILTTAGTVQAKPFGIANWQPAKEEQTLEIRDQVRTGFKSSASLRLADKSILKMKQLSTIEIQPPEDESERKVLNFRSGAAYFFNREDPGTTRFRTPSASGAIRGTEFHVDVAEDGTTVLTLLDGEVDIGNEQGDLALASGEQAIVEPGQAPRKTAVIDAINIIQWALYYPGVIDLKDLAFDDPSRQALSESIEAYDAGDLVAALETYPTNRADRSNSELIYSAALSLSVGLVEEANEELAEIESVDNPVENELVAAIHEMVAAVKNQPVPATSRLQTSSGWLARSYALQAQGQLYEALKAARQSTELSPRFGFAWARVAELEFSFGQIDKADFALDRALGHAPRNAQAVALQGFVAAANNDMELAREYFQQAIDLDGNLGNAWLGLGLTRIHEGDPEQGRADIQVAATLEPDRAILRSYLGKAWNNQHDNELASKELELAKRLDPGDPTAWLYSAVIKKEENRINEAVEELEESKELNRNRRIYRSQMLLDQDQAVRGVNLASVYRDAGMIDFSVREATRAVNNDYANASAHLFLANSYFENRDFKGVNNRYDAPWLNELLLANLLSPVGAGSLSQNVSFQEYSKLFSEDGFGVLSTTDYFSNGDWQEFGSQYGTFGNTDYSIDVVKLNYNGERSNNDFDLTTVYGKFKQQLTRKDTVFAQAVYQDIESGDVNQYYNQNTASTTRRIKSDMEPTLIAGYHRKWNPNSDTLLLFGRIEEDLRVSDPNPSVIGVNLAFDGSIEGLDEVNSDVNGLNSALNQRFDRDFEVYSVEAQQIWRTSNQSLILGTRYQTGTTKASSQMSVTAGLTTLTVGDPVPSDTDQERFSLYVYDFWNPVEYFQVHAGFVYDYMIYPSNASFPPFSDEEESQSQLSPKLGFVWTMSKNTFFRGAYTQSIGGTHLDQQFRIEPVQIAGFTQTFRSLAPESAVGIIGGTEFETYGLALDHAFPTRTYITLEAQILESEGERDLGALDNRSGGFFSNTYADPTLLNQSIDFSEQSVKLSINQLVLDELAFGANYKISHSDMAAKSNDFAETGLVSGADLLYLDREAWLHQVNLDGLFNHSSGVFAHANANWNQQSNQGFAPDRPGDDFWQFNFWIGYRFLERRAEVRLGILNIADQDYRLDPLTLYQELPRDRMLTARLKINF